MNSHPQHIIEVSERFFFEEALPRLMNDFPEEAPFFGAGLVGNGSNCFGFDDELSRDHDWGIDFLLWLPQNKLSALQPTLREWKQLLFNEYKQYEGFPFYDAGPYGVHANIVSPESFYASLIGCPAVPQTIAEWRRIPEENLALATNGRIFCDPVGAFSATREGLLAYYPHDLWLKRIAAHCAAAAQTGQYNFLRCAQRKDHLTKQLVLSRFAEEAIALVFLLNRTYKPYYKWAARKMSELPLLSEHITPLLNSLFFGPKEQAEPPQGSTILFPLDESDKACAAICEKICRLLADELRRQGLTSTKDDYLLAHAQEIQAQVQDSFLASLPIQYS